MDAVDDGELVRLGPAGSAHLELLENINYLAAIAEDTFFEDRITAAAIVEKMKNPDTYLHTESTRLRRGHFLHAAKSGVETVVVDGA